MITLRDESSTVRSELESSHQRLTVVRASVFTTSTELSHLSTRNEELSSQVTQLRDEVFDFCCELSTVESSAPSVAFIEVCAERNLIFAYFVLLLVRSTVLKKNIVTFWVLYAIVDLLCDAGLVLFLTSSVLSLILLLRILLTSVFCIP